MKVAIVYIFPPCDGQKHWDYAARFLSSYAQYPPGAEHETIVVVNGGKVTPEIRCLFASLQKVRFLEHDDSGWDIGGFQRAAREYPDFDLMVFFGGSTFFLRPGWLRRMLTAYQNHGEALYGAMGNRGDLHVRVWPHIRTTGFWMPPKLLNRYPKKVKTYEERYEFEHGAFCLTGWVRKQGLRAWVVSWTADYLWEHWDDAPNGFNRGDQSNILCGDRITELYRPRARR